MLVALGVCGCGDGMLGPNKNGELSNGRFAYLCLGDSDPYCDASGAPTAFPETLAVGGRFDLEYDPDDWPFDDEPLPRVVPASPVSVESPGMGYAISRPGFAAFLARDAFGEIFDLRHLYAARVARVAVTTEASQELDTISLEPGASIDLRAEPQDDLRAVLGGSLDYVWTSDDDTVARFASVDMDRDVTLQAVGLGTTTIRIEAGGFVQMITVEVGDELPGGSSGTTDEGGSTGSGGPDDGTTGDGTGDDAVSTGGESDGGESGSGSSGDADTGSTSTGGN